MGTSHSFTHFDCEFRPAHTEQKLVNEWDVPIFTPCRGNESGTMDEPTKENSARGSIRLRGIR